MPSDLATLHLTVNIEKRSLVMPRRACYDASIGDVQYTGETKADTLHGLTRELINYLDNACRIAATISVHSEVEARERELHVLTSLTDAALGRTAECYDLELIKERIGLLRCELSPKAKRTRALMEYLRERIAAAIAEPIEGTGIVRKCSIRTARLSEWHMLFTILTAPESTRDMYDMTAIVKRCDELRRELPLRSKQEDCRPDHRPEGLTDKQYLEALVINGYDIPHHSVLTETGLLTWDDATHVEIRDAAFELNVFGSLRTFADMRDDLKRLDPLCAVLVKLRNRKPDPPPVLTMPRQDRPCWCQEGRQAAAECPRHS